MSAFSDSGYPLRKLKSSSAGQGAELVEYRGGTVEGALDKRHKNYDSIAALGADSASEVSIGDRVVVSSYYGDGKSPEIKGSICAGGTGTLSQGYVDLANGYQLKMEFGNEVYLESFGAKGDFDFTLKTGTDNTLYIKAALSYLGGTSGIATEFRMSPVKRLRIGAGHFGVKTTGTDRILITLVDNISIDGAGMFNTTIIHFGTANVAELIRFKGAYSCEINNLTIDGGLPFTPDGTETYGVDVPLTLDQCAFFGSVGLNIQNYRLRGKQCAHLWESYFDNLRISNGGFFGTGAAPSACIAFDERNAEYSGTVSAGFESNQVYYGKVLFGGVGTYVKMTQPCFNVSFQHVIAETRTWPIKYTSADEAKWIIGGLSSDVVVHQAWTYAHDQTYTSSAILFNFQNAGSGCKFLNYNVYQEIPSASGNKLEVNSIFANSSAYPVEVSLSIQDAGDAVTTLFSSAAPGSMLTGRIDYQSALERTKADFLGSLASTYFSGSLTMAAGSFTTTDPDVYEHVGKAQRTSCIDGSGEYPEFACRAIANFDGSSTGGSRMQKGVAITRTGVGSYAGVFTTPMPDAFYSLNLSAVFSNLNDNIEIGSLTNTGFNFVIRDGAGTLHDSQTICISVFR